MKKAAIYIRVSTQEQAQEGYSIQAQKDKLLSYCMAKDWHVHDIYVDPGYSGSNIDRPGMQSLISNIKNFDLVLVYKLDRLSRSQKDTLYLIEDVFLANDVDFVSLNESFDTSTPFGRAMIGILAVFAQLEREQIKERSLMGRVERAKDGIWHGGGNVPIGYEYINGGLVINDDEAKQVRDAFQLYVTGMGLDAVGRELRAKGYTHKYGSWESYSTVRNVLLNSVYIGNIKFGGETYKGVHDPIIDSETFETAQIMLNKRKRGQTYLPSYMLTGLTYCGRCGARYAVHNSMPKDGKPYGYYTCYSRSKSKRHMVRDENCKNKNWPTTQLDAFVDSEIRNLMVNQNQIEFMLHKKNNVKTNDKEIASIKRKIVECDKKTQKLMDMYLDDKFTPEEIGLKADKIHEDKRILLDRLKDLSTGNTESNIDIVQMHEMLTYYNELWDIMDIPGKRNVLSTLIDKIVIDGDRVDIKWVFMRQ